MSKLQNVKINVYPGCNGVDTFRVVDLDGYTCVSDINTYANALEIAKRVDARLEAEKEYGFDGLQTV